ncbi:MAG TPA: RNA 2',3'-cyclic phosphodiesterase [Candidatus Eremiobacteraceae bacterium]|nr:RNA 2',3'-cyclic phosphodiesterase [Candidatus Eremiobacteraceae bacterium]
MSGRLFVAVDLDEPMRDLIDDAIARLKAAGLDERFTSREKWHATLAFLGPVDASRRAAISEAIATAAKSCDAFDLTLDVVGAFPDARRPKVVWVGSSSPQTGFAACAEAVRAQLSAIGFDFEFDAVPHVTVCRLKRSGPLPAVGSLNPRTIHVDSLTLYESAPQGSSTRYAVLGEMPLR